jgi:hypothetical protein
MVPKGQTKDFPAMLSMVRDLRKMAMEVASDAKIHVNRTISVIPFSQAVKANLMAFFVFTDVKQLCQLYDGVIDWLPQKDLNLTDFRWHMREHCDRWVKKSKSHPGLMQFAAKHCMNVICMWPRSKDTSLALPPMPEPTPAKQKRKYNQ